MLAFSFPCEILKEVVDFNKWAKKQEKTAQFGYFMEINVYH